MTISMLQSLPIGNAMRVFLNPPPTALLWRVLRTALASFVDENDPSAVVLYEGDQDRTIVDASGLVNGTPYTYGAFYFDGTGWSASPVVVGTPAATYTDQSTDVLTVVQERIESGLKVEITRGVLSPQEGVIAVLNAPPAIDDTRFPVVTVQVVTDGSGKRALGELIAQEDVAPNPLTGAYEDAEGWLARVHLSVIGWSKNADERITLRQVLRRLVIGNLSVFDAAGITEVEFTQTDVNDMAQQPPIYASDGAFTCFAPAIVRGTVEPVSDITVTPVAEFSGAGVVQTAP